MKKVILIATIAAALTGCTSAAQRMQECEAQGISRDTCYLAEQNRQSARQAAAMGAAEAQALHNLDTIQRAQSAHKSQTFVKHYD